jgi:hypothetical protein
MKAKRDYLNRVHSDHLVLEIVRREAEPCDLWPKATQGGPQGFSLLRSDVFLDGQAKRLDSCPVAKTLN